MLSFINVIFVACNNGYVEIHVHGPLSYVSHLTLFHLQVTVFYALWPICDQKKEEAVIYGLHIVYIQTTSIILTKAANIECGIVAGAVFNNPFPFKLHKHPDVENVVS